MSKDNLNFYLDINALFDLRLGVLHNINHDAAAKLMLNPYYRQRFTDDFSLIDNKFDIETYRERYKNRSNEDLFASAPTGVLKLILEIIRTYLPMHVLKENSDPITVHLNTYPFNLSESAIDHISGLLMAHTACEQVKVSNLEPGFLTPSYLGSFGTVVMYDLDSWLNIHISNFTTAMPMLQTMVICPLLMVKPPIQNMDVMAVIKEVKDSLQGFFCYVPEPINKFCVDTELL